MVIRVLLFPEDGTEVERMNADERQHRILVLARSNGDVDVGKLAAELAVAPETIRRDLRTLEQHGLVRRTHGGARAVETARFETTLAMRTTRRVPEKRRIAAACADLVGDAETIFVDEGFTPQLIAEALPADRSLTVVTASLSTAAVLAANPATTVLLLGGGCAGARSPPWITGPPRCWPASSSTWRSSAPTGSRASTGSPRPTRRWPT
ncbi:hypothetical protein Phou_072970 [Phytohabitans houttuyneae]|uniref:Lactose phosphotransferase system repressor n=1 Tax=Phytohabitans houttuyneae TaxID=1076126 RepID=A0A6V8KMZ7_9ACTN|nr:hypothetical protein Phou_072970 [Phytohabitans houttuyneae]